MGKKLLLMPECQELWILSPTLLFEYERVIMDEKDYVRIINPEIKTKHRIERAECLKKWKEFNLRHQPSSSLADRQGVCGQSWFTASD